MLKYAMEILLSESSVVTSYYFEWSTSTVAIFLAILGLTVLPVNAIVGSYMTQLFEDRQKLFVMLFFSVSSNISQNWFFHNFIKKLMKGFHDKSYRIKDKRTPLPPKKKEQKLW
jgi:hypothetical protein